MLGQFDVSRLGALKHAGEDLAQQVHATKIESMLEAASSTGLQIMCFVGNRGMIQIHTGPVKHIVTQGPWLNGLDPTFNLHLNMADVTSVWVVTKPTSDGWVTSLEVYDAYGELIVQFFGARKPGSPELPAWRELMASLGHTPCYP
jgi:putative hemin transport protein